MISDDTIDALLARARGGLNRVSPLDLASAVSDGAAVVDVRDTAQRVEQGELPSTPVSPQAMNWRMFLAVEEPSSTGTPGM